MGTLESSPFEKLWAGLWASNAGTLAGAKAVAAAAAAERGVRPEGGTQSASR